IPGLGNDESMPDEEKKKFLSSVDPYSLLLSAVSVEPLKESMIMLISYESVNPKLAMEVANETALAYQSENLDYKRQVVRDAYAELSELVKNLKDKKEGSEKMLYDFENEHSIGTIDNRIKEIEMRLTAFNEKLNQARAQRIEVEAKLGEIRKYKSTKDIFSIALGEVINNSLIVQMKKEFFDLEKTLQDIQTLYLASHPKYLAVKNQMDTIERNIRKEIENIEKAVEHEFNEIVSVEKSLQQGVVKAKEEERDLSWKKIEYERLSQKKKKEEEFFDKVAKRETETQLTSQIETNNVRILDLAVEPKAPVKPKKRLNISLGILFGLLGGILAAFLAEFLDNTVKGREDIEELIKVNFLGIIPTISEEAKESLQGYDRDFHVLHKPKSSAAECSRIIRTNLLFMLPERKNKSLLVTSPNPQEGKTTIVINIGINMAQSGSRTLLIDSDMRRPRLHKTFSSFNDRGLSTYLIGGSSFVEAIWRTEIENLDLMPCGPIPPNPAELLHTRKFQELLEDIGRNYEVVVFDSPPILAVTDAMIIGSSVDGVVLVAKSGYTTKDSLQHAKKMLEGVNVRILGSVLNDIDLENRSYGYYYYRYKYNYYYGEKKKEDAEAV
ncbi:MAG: polysaccharide biosynthesis tyrosine autokinase, partial [Deltaproteobacteria bacterium]|nr:polysaccharide biosynthesis tyrosine autokinase [Deltaproteobacteria bacterium]